MFTFFLIGISYALMLRVNALIISIDSSLNSFSALVHDNILLLLVTEIFQKLRCEALK